MKIAFLGASLTRGNVSASFVDRVRTDGEKINAGLNGDLAWSALQRLPAVLARKPDVVVVLVGSNDVMASMSEEKVRQYTWLKKLPQRPSIEWYRACIDDVVAGIQASGAHAVVCSLPMLGEDLAADVNVRVRAYNDVLREVAVAHNATFVDVYAAMTSALTSSRPGRGYSTSNRLMFRSMLLRFVLRMRFDRISRINGFALMTDGIHVNERGAEIIAEAITVALDAGLRSR